MKQLFARVTAASSILINFMILKAFAFPCCWKGLIKLPMISYGDNDERNNK